MFFLHYQQPHTDTIMLYIGATGFSLDSLTSIILTYVKVWMSTMPWSSLSVWWAAEGGEEERRTEEVTVHFFSYLCLILNATEEPVDAVLVPACPRECRRSRKLLTGTRLRARYICVRLPVWHWRGQTHTHTHEHTRFLSSVWPLV